MADRGRGGASGSAAADGADVLSLLDWRRRIAELYAAIRRSEPEPGWALWRGTRDALFGSHPQSPLGPAERAAFRGLPVAPYDPALRFVVACRPVEDAPAIRVELGPDGVLFISPFARTEGLADALGAELTLYRLGGYGGGVFLPFRDATSGRESYGGGRYLLDTIKGADLGAGPDGRRLVLDFNFSYNPSCAYSDAWICPLAPPENRVPAPLRAGEARPGGSWDS